MEKTRNFMEMEKRDSNIELFRIVLMFLIIAHHYTVNSGLDTLYDFKEITGNMLFLQFFGMFGKTAINGFTLITGFYMVKSKISAKKFMKIYLEAEFYYILFYLFFIVTGYESFTIKGLVTTIFFVVFEVGGLYTGTYIVFFLFIPFLNILARNMNQKQYQLWLLLLITYFTGISTLVKHDTFDFLGWLITMYFVGGYIRLWPCKLFYEKKIAAVCILFSILLMMISILLVDFLGVKYGFSNYYYMLADSHKPLAVMCSVSAFLFFKNLKIRKNRIINLIASSTFAVLLIHTNSNTMRKFLWEDVFRNTAFYNSDFLIIHAISSVFIVYIVCFFLDWGRRKLWNVFLDHRKRDRYE